MQLIHQGKAKACNAQVNFPKDWFITHTPNHWANEDTINGTSKSLFFPMSAKKECVEITT